MANQLQLANFWGRKRSNSSFIWNHFGFNTNEKGEITDKSKAVCKYCRAELKYQQGSTTNMQHHYNTYHLATSEPSSSSQPTIATAFGKPKQYSLTSPRHHLLQGCAAEHLVCNLQPFSLVDSSSFKKLIFNLDPKFQLQSRNTYSNTVVPNMYTNVRKKVLEMLRPVDALACTSDCWTSAAKQSYMTITAHFIDDWNMKSLCLQTRHCPEQHTAEHLKELHLAAFKEWQIEEKEITGCVDNARNIVNAWELMGKTCMFCFGHTLNLSVKKGLAVDGVKEIVADCRKLVGYFNHSYLGSGALKSKQKQLDMPVKTLKQDVETRWNSTYDMITSVIDNDEAISTILRGDAKHRNMLLSAETIALLKDIQVVLSPMKKLTEHMSGESYVTLSLVAPTIHQLIKNTLKIDQDNDSVVMQRLKNAMLNDIQTRYQSSNTKLLLQIAAFLDPRFRNLDFLEEDEKKKVRLDIKRRMVSLHEQAKPVIKTEPEEPQQLPSISNDSCSVSDTSDTTTEPPAKKCKVEKSFFEHFFPDITITKVEPPVSSMDKAKKEVKLYLSLSAAAAVKPALDVLQWWKLHENQLPMMAKLAKHILCVPATSTPSERMFSKAGNLITEKRANLNPKKVDMMLFLNANYRL